MPTPPGAAIRGVRSDESTPGLLLEPPPTSHLFYAILWDVHKLILHMASAFLHQLLQFDKYEEASEAVYKILLKHTTAVQPISCDEAYLDVTGLSDPFQIAAAIRAEVALAKPAAVEVDCNYLSPPRYLAESITGFLFRWEWRFS